MSIGQSGCASLWHIIHYGVRYRRVGQMLAVLSGMTCLSGLGNVVWADDAASLLSSAGNVPGETENTEDKSYPQGTIIDGDFLQKSGTVGLDGVLIKGTLHLDGGLATFGEETFNAYSGTSAQSLAGAGNGELVSPADLPKQLKDKRPFQLPGVAGAPPNQGELRLTNGQGQTYSGSLKGNGVLTLASGTQSLTGKNELSGVVDVQNGTLHLQQGGVLDGGATPYAQIIVGMARGDNGHLMLDGAGAHIHDSHLFIGNGDASFSSASARIGPAGASDVTLQHGAQVEDQLGKKRLVAIGGQQDGTSNVESGSKVAADMLVIGTDVGSKGILNMSGDGTLVEGTIIIGAGGVGAANVTDGAVLQSDGTLQFGVANADSTSNGTLIIGPDGTLLAGDSSSDSAITVAGKSQGIINFDEATVQNVDGKDLTSTVGATLSGTNRFDVQANHQMSWQNGVTGNGGITKTGAGTLNLSGGNVSYTGQTDVHEGTLHLDHVQLGGNVINRGSTLVTHGGYMQSVEQNAGNAQGTSHLNGTTFGTITLNSGDMSIEESLVRSDLHQQGGTLAMNNVIVRGALRVEGGSFSVGPDGISVHDLAGHTEGVLAGNLRIMNNKDSYAGMVTGVGEITLNPDEALDDRMLLFRDADVTSDETEDDHGPGWRYVGNSPDYLGAFVVKHSFTLVMDGYAPKAGARASHNGTLTGIGTSGKVNIDSTSIFAPGDWKRLGTFHIINDLTMAAGSVLRIRGDGETIGLPLLAGDGLSYTHLKSDMVQVGGKAILQGGTVDLHVQNSAALTYGQAYRIVTTGGGVTGRYDKLVTNLGSQYAYLSPALVYGSNDIDITLVRNGRGFETAGTTRNEIEAGRGLDHMAPSSGLARALEVLSKDEARHALNNLSGELHASIRTALIQDSFYIRNAVLNRLANRDCDYGRNGQKTHIIKSNKGHITTAAETSNAVCASDSEHVVLWGQAYGGLGHNGGDGNAALMHHNTAGFIMGMDAPIRGTNWRAGGMMSYGHSMFDLGRRSSSGNSSNMTIGGYAGTNWGKLNLRLGAAYSWNIINTRRQITIGSYGGRVNSRYLGGTAQAFAELGYKMRSSSGRSVFEPFMRVAYVNMQTNGYRERGNEAALRERGMDTGVTFSTFGFRSATRFNIGKMIFRPHFTGAHRHGFGQMRSTQRGAFAVAGGSNDMDVSGISLSNNAAIIDTGLTARLTDRIDVDLSYIGQYGNHFIESGITGSMKFRF